MSTAEAKSSAEAVGLLDFGECLRAPADAFKVPVAWPATAWRVIIPRVRKSATDPLQRAVLRIIRAGCKGSQDIGSWLDIPGDLIRTLLPLYVSEGYITAECGLTTAGVKLLDEDDALTFSDNSHQTAWMLRDDWTGDMIPFLLEEDLKWSPKDRRSEFTVLKGERLTTEKPGSLSIRRALLECRRLSAYKSGSATATGLAATPVELAESHSENSVQAPESDVPGIVQLLWERSERVYIPAWFVVAADDPSIWTLVTNLPSSPVDQWFASKLSWAANRIPELRAQMDGWLTDARELFPVKPTLAQTGEQVVVDHPLLAIRQELSDTRIELARAYRARALFDETPENIDVFLGRCYRVLEALLSACIIATPIRQQAIRLIREDGFAEQVREIATRFGVELPNGFANRQYVNKVRRAATGRAESLRDRALLLLFCAQYDSHSPMRRVFNALPNVFVHVDTVYLCRNSWSGHYNSRSSGSGDESAMANQVSASIGKIVAALAAAFFGEHS